MHVYIWLVRVQFDICISEELPTPLFFLSIFVVQSKINLLIYGHFCKTKTYTQFGCKNATYACYSQLIVSVYLRCSQSLRKKRIVEKIYVNVRKDSSMGSWSVAKWSQMNLDTTTSCGLIRS